MKVYIAEKPSLARAIAEALPKPQYKEDGYIRLANGDCITWCIGHLLELAEPHDYDENLRKWRLEQLPIVPSQWQLRAKTGTRKQLHTIKQLLKQATQIVHAGDPDREGQLLVDEVLHHLELKAARLDQVQRLLINDMNPEAVSRALANLQANSAFAALSASALARSRADWLYGINMTRAYSLQGQQKGYSGVLSVGRVQTPILGLIVRRDAEIQHFVSKDFFEVRAHIHPLGKPEDTFFAKWQPSDACAPYCDDEGRVLSKALAENVVKRIYQQPAHLQTLTRQPKRNAPPLPYSLSALQIDAAHQLHMSAQQVLEICQVLYEQHKLITYPRSDSRYLPAEQFSQAKQILQVIQHNLPQATQAVAEADATHRGKCWNSAKVEAHHAIIPTLKQLDSTRLSGQQLGIYRLICRQYLAQFYPDHRYIQVRMEFIIAGGLFSAQGQEPVEIGWKKLFTKPPKLADQDTEDPPQNLPTLKQGDECHCPQGEVITKRTQPPKYFNDANLMSAMTGINRFVQDATLKKILKDTDGIGTEATRAGIVELLFKRDFIYREGKNIRATEKGKALIEALPEVASTPDMTASWEQSLAAIHSKTLAFDDFMNPLTAQLNELIAQSRKVEFARYEGKPAAAVVKKRAKRQSSVSGTKKTIAKQRKIRTKNG